MSDADLTAASVALDNFKLAGEAALLSLRLDFCILNVLMTRDYARGAWEIAEILSMQRTLDAKRSPDT